MSLRRSNVRRQALLHLAKIHPDSSYLMEIARAVKHSSTDVLGALMGSNNRFVKEHSLVELKLVEVTVDKRGRKWYKATEAGMKMAESQFIQ